MGNPPDDLGNARVKTDLDPVKLKFSRPLTEVGRKILLVSNCYRPASSDVIKTR